MAADMGMKNESTQAPGTSPEDKTLPVAPQGPIADPPFVLKRYHRSAPGVFDSLGVEDEVNQAYNLAMAEGQPWYKKPIVLFGAGVLLVFAVSQMTKSK